jgi:hypothetical protein
MRIRAGAPLMLVGLCIGAVPASVSVAASAHGPDRRQVASAAGLTHRHVRSFRGLGTWVDLYDSAARADPDAAVAAMAAHGAKTLYLETSNFGAGSAVVSPSIVSRFVVAAHAHGMRIVAWYLPSFGRPARDRYRSLAAIRYRTAGGESFDAFALDIESTRVVDPAVRTARLIDLATGIRAAAGARYSLGAIVPAPVAMSDRPDYWPGFPFRPLRTLFDVFLPMDYFTYHFTTARQAHRYTAGNIEALRVSTADASLPIHVIGGVADHASVREVRAFVHAGREFGALGASLYDDATTTAGQWAELASVPFNPIQRPALPLQPPVDISLGNIPGGDRSHPRELFYRTPGLAGSYVLRYRGFDLQPGEVQLWVNWTYVRTLRPTTAGAWSGVRKPPIPAGLLRTRHANYVQFLAAGSYPAWSVWGMRGVSLARVS